MSANKYMLTIELDSEQYSRLKQLAEISGREMDEAVRDSFNLYDAAVEAVAGGATVLLRNKSGAEMVLMGVAR